MSARRTLAALLALWAASITSPYAQQAEPSRFAVDTVAAADEAIDERGNPTTGVTLDAVVSVGLGGGLEAIVRPFVQRLSTGEWNRQVWVAAVRYERPGPVSLRVDAGLIPSPVGLANMMLRPHLSPTISLPASLFVPLPAVEPGAPRTNVLGVMYPYGVNVTVSGRRWDARTAVIDMSPLRSRRVFARTNPPRFANMVVGGGLTPMIGLRIGASVTHGGWQRAGETPQATAARDATVVTVESEFSLRYTTLKGEWVRDLLETTSGRTDAWGWFVQGHQALTPRWFAAARIERMGSPAMAALATAERQRFTGFEETIGYRVTPEVTLRAGHRARRGFGRQEYDHQAAVSVVWWRRWL